jgi:hypothetical protein
MVFVMPCRGKSNCNQIYYLPTGARLMSFFVNISEDNVEVISYKMRASFLSNPVLSKKNPGLVCIQQFLDELCAK